MTTCLMRDTPVCCDLSRPRNPASPREEVTGFDPTEGSLEEMRASVSLDIEHSAKVINPYRTLSGALGNPRHQRVGESVHKWGEGRMRGYAAPVLKQAVDDSDGFVMVTA